MTPHVVLERPGNCNPTYFRDAPVFPISPKAEWGPQTGKPGRDDTKVCDGRYRPTTGRWAAARLPTQNVSGNVGLCTRTFAVVRDRHIYV